MPGVVRRSWYSRRQIRENSETYFVFGDNMIEQGLGGQAEAARGEPNTIGVPIKRLPAMQDSAFLKDEDLDDHEIMSRIDAAFAAIEARLEAGHDVILPVGKLGVGSARLHLRAPKLFAYINSRLEDIEARYSCVDEPAHAADD